ncbi:MAG: ABC transporter substrate-binding protein [Nannocystaceae bacterium]|nr:ABC transporter substrate-binding protein [bacterium]
MRIVSLLPSATEIVCALGAQADLVGTSHECDYPPQVQSLPRLTRARIDLGGDSLAIDNAVRHVIRNALSIYAVDESRLAALRPDVIITQDLCEVCAVSLDDVRSAVARIAQREEVKLVSLSPTRLDDVLGDVERVAEALGLGERGAAVRTSLQARLDALTARSAAIGHRPRVASIEWIEPIMLGGTWMPELISRAGGEPVGVEDGAPAPTLSPTELAALEPDVVVLKPCGFTIERTLEERERIATHIVSALPPTTAIYVADGNAFFNRPGPRLVESAEILAACTHPEAFPELARAHGANVRRW